MNYPFDVSKEIRIKITPYYKALLNALGPTHPLRRTIFPTNEITSAPGDLEDPLGEEDHSPLPSLVHTYPDKVLLLITLHCAVICRYCTRKRLVGGRSNSSETDHAKAHDFSKNWKLSPKIIRYLERHTGIRDVLLSGGDPLTLSDAKLDKILSQVRRIKHIRTVRIGSKIPAVLPKRITSELAAILANHRVWLQLHIVHPAELTDEMTRACDTLVEAGVPMVSQTVLLKGINDDTNTLTDLFYGLLERRIKPYYLFQCDPVVGSSSFRTSVNKGLQLIHELEGRVSGLALPTFAIDAPGGGGKVPLLSEKQFRRENHEIILTNYQGKEYRYPDQDN